ncbi:type VI secretion system tip protein VgrG [Archangium violaceum]|uniref:type VI secretion system Vgr family protein n=1 Tax=Archangium violaceum TaxID=83451 RepID=UPI00193B9315|nr:type VI secretion system tip protein VgrG [Archangium violaceum]QRK11415.1 type VI secretion system tip protein VgrG [Archangium violaceum]
MVARAHVHQIGGSPVFLFDIGGFDAPMRVVRFSGAEGLSSLFEFQVELACENQGIDFAQVVGKSALLAIRGEAGFRHLNGIISRFEQVNELPRFAIYRATVVPLVWRLQHRHDCRIFQKLDTPAILKKVFEAAGVPADKVRFSLMGSYEPRDYCVQYRESDWAFASRLMEEDGIFYFFEHHEDKHILVLGDKESAFKPIDGAQQLPFRRSTGGVVLEDHVARFRRVQEVRPGRTSLRDFNYKKPGLPMEAKHEAEVDADLEVYDYPGEYLDPGRGSSAKGATIARLRLEAWQASRVQGQGQSDCERLVPGRLFTLAEHSRGDYNGRYLLTHVSHAGSQPQTLDEESDSGDFSYSNHFTCIPEKVPYRPPRVTPRPHVRGGQTAVVVGPSGEEIHVDEWGRVKVQFHWDRQGKLDENSSCWVRVSQLWAGEQWGRMFIPRIGQEVIVDFIEGDPDRPIITGRLYNGANLVPYELPAEKTKSTIKSNSSLGGDGYNELRFEDEKNKEQFFMHAERNMDVHVKNDSFENILHDRHQTIGSQGKNGKAGDQNELVFRDKSLTVHRHSQEHVGGNLKRLVGGIDGAGDVDIVIKSNRTELVHKDSHLHVKECLVEKVDGTQSLQVGKDQHTSVGQVTAVETGKEVHLKSNKIVIEAATGITVQGPGGFITIDASGIAIKGTMVLINSGGSALSGSGVSPTAPKDAVEAVPTVPALADDGKVRPPSGLAVAQGGSELAPVAPMKLAATMLPLSVLQAREPTVTCVQLANQIDEMDQATVRAGLAADVYNRYDPSRAPDAPIPPPPPGFTRPSDDPEQLRALFKGRLSDQQLKDLTQPEGSSYRAAIYQDQSGKTYLTFRGTENKEGFKDWKENLLQGSGMESQHYEKAKKLAERLDLAVGPGNLEIIGHSKGGGMAAAAGVVTGARTTTFNPAGVHPKTVGGANLANAAANINAYVVEGEVLNWVQDNRAVIQGGAVVAGTKLGGPVGGMVAAMLVDGTLPQATGRRVNILPSKDFKSAWYDPVLYRVDLHGMDQVKKSLEEHRETLQNAYVANGCEAQLGKR